jgi:hypothetical protein
MRGGGLGLPDRVQRKGFGAVAAAWGLLEDLGVAGIIDEVAGARRPDAGASVGHGGIRLTWHAYPGDKPDVTQFATMISQLAGRSEAIAAACGNGGNSVRPWPPAARRRRPR